MSDTCPICGSTDTEEVTYVPADLQPYIERSCNACVAVWHQVLDLPHG